MRPGEYETCPDHCRLCAVTWQPHNFRSLENTLLAGTEWFEWIPGLSDIRQALPADEPYVYYETPSRECYVFRAPQLPRQYLRQVLASLRGCPHAWDWRRTPCLETIDRFVAKVRGIHDVS